MTKFAIPFLLATFLSAACDSDSDNPPTSPHLERPRPGNTPPEDLDLAGVQGTLTASTQQLNLNREQPESTRITWEVRGAERCFLNEDEVEVKGEIEAAPTSDTFFTLTCKRGQGTWRRSVKVEVASIQLQAQDTSLFPWEDTYLSSKGEHVQNCEMRAEDGSASFTGEGSGVFAGPGTYRISCEGFGGKILRHEVIIATRTEEPTISLVVSTPVQNFDKKPQSISVSVQVRSSSIDFCSMENGYDSIALHGDRVDVQTTLAVESNAVAVEVNCSGVIRSTRIETLPIAWMSDVELPPPTPVARGTELTVTWQGSTSLTDCRVISSAGDTLPLHLDADLEIRSSTFHTGTFEALSEGTHALVCSGVRGHEFRHPFAVHVQ